VSEKQQTPAEIAAEVGIGLIKRVHTDWLQKLVHGLAGARPALPNDRLHAAFKRTEAPLIVAVEKWHHILGYPGGMTICGRCHGATQWSVCPECQPAEFARLP
jgi:hypothetical protein